ncbi:hypothetical protein SL053_002299, partial [Flavobacterium psychrophilum]|nr:hypothetical protein [Flavobacterium psychrophilum]
EELVKPKKASEPKIVKVELLDSQGEKPTKPLSYGQTVIVKVHCTEHEYGMVNVTLWEDDAKGKGHNKINEKNFAQTKQAEVKRGIAETKFVLSPSFAKMAEAQKAKGSSSEGTTHEYYVTATIKDKNDASNNIEVNVPQKPVPPLKKRVPVQTPITPHAPLLPIQKKPVVPAKPATPAVPVSPSTTPGITNVVLTKTSATTLHAAIYHNKLHGKKIRFKLMEDDGGKLVDDELINEIYTFPKDTNYLYIAINLKAISVSKGGTFTQEGFYQELFVDVEVLETHKQTKTGTLNVDISAFKPDPADITNKVVKIWESIFGKDEKEKKKEKKGVCPNCDKDITAADLKQIFTQADDDTLKKVAATYSKYMKELNMNTCWNKAHFFAQVVVESGLKLNVKEGENFNWYKEALKTTFGAFMTEDGKKMADILGRQVKNKNDRGYVALTIEEQKKVANYAYSPSSKKGKELGNTDENDGWDFRGKGLVQLTGRTGYTEANKYTIKEGADILENPDLVTTDASIAVLSSMAFWKWKKIDTITNGNSVNKPISKKVGNEVGDSYTEKQNAFTNKTSITFKINECKIGKKVETTDSVTIRLVRKWETEISTIGEFTVDNSDIKGYILEEKGPDTTVSGNQQRVPIGTYNLKWHNGTKQKGVLKLYNDSVPESRAILIHSGNNADDTEGCLLTGTTKSKDSVGASKPKLTELNNYVTLKGIEGAKIIITANYE